MKRHLLGHADEASLTNLNDHQLFDNTSGTKFDQVHEPQSGSVDLNAAQAQNLDWYEALAVTAQTVSEESPSFVHHSQGLPNKVTRQSVIPAVLRPEMTIASQSRSLEVIDSRDNSVQCLGNGSLETASPNQPRDLKLPPELFNTMVDDYARRWLRELCNK